uniref:Cytochrome-c oxidase n=1 Tax=Meloidogyne hapla TaxID=6305 RepID=A0A1I8B0D7_MELHA
MLNTSTGIAYAYNMNHSDHGILSLMFAHFSWVHIHGVNIFIFFMAFIFFILHLHGKIFMALYTLKCQIIQF